jgi:hypothetical protein
MRQTTLLVATLFYSAIGFCQQPTFSLHGTVIDKDTKKPVKGVDVNLIGPDGFNHVKASDTNGYYYFGPGYFKPNTSYIIDIYTYDVKNLNSGSYEAVPLDTLNTSGYKSSKDFVKNWEVYFKEPKGVDYNDMTPVVSTNDTISLKPEFSVSGLVTDIDTKKPLTNLDIELKAKNTGQTITFKTDSTGYYFIAPSFIKPNTNYLITVTYTIDAELSFLRLASFTTIAQAQSEVLKFNFEMHTHRLPRNRNIRN